MTTTEWIALAAVGISLLAVVLSTRRSSKQDTTSETKAFTRLEVMMENVLSEIKTMGRSLDKNTQDQAACNTEIALLKQRVSSLEAGRVAPKRARSTEEGE